MWGTAEERQPLVRARPRGHLAAVAAGEGAQPVAYDASTLRMAKMPGYDRSAAADNANVFHGREVRKVPTAAGGMGFVLQLVHAEDDPDGWTAPEVAGYDGWGHDSGRKWRNGALLESEGYERFRETFGPEAYTLHHRFYLHLDGANRMWLAAEDGCQGFPAPAKKGFMKLFG